MRAFLSFVKGNSDVKKQGIAQGAAQQKAEDDKLIAQKDAEVSRQAAEIARLKALLAAK